MRGTEYRLCSLGTWKLFFVTKKLIFYSFLVTFLGTLGLRNYHVEYVQSGLSYNLLSHLDKKIWFKIVSKCPLNSN